MNQRPGLYLVMTASPDHQGKLGPVALVQPGKVRITIRIDADILNWFREKVNERGGGNYQTMMNDALRSYIQHQDKMLEETIRKVIREELRTHPQGDY